MSLLDQAREARSFLPMRGEDELVSITAEARDALVELADAHIDWRKSQTNAEATKATDRFEAALERLRA
jgi:hypothetical protein